MQHHDITVSKQREGRVRSHIAAVDAGDQDAVVAFFSPDARQRFGNRPWIYGRSEIEAAYVAFKSVINGIRNEITGLWESSGTVILRSDVHCERLDGAVIEIPTMCTFTEDPDGLIHVFQMWSDWTPLFPVVPLAANRR